MKTEITTGFTNANEASSKEKLAELGYKCFTKAYFLGYVSRKGHECYEYEGRYGKGYVVIYNDGKSTRYSVLEYWVK